MRFKNILQHDQRDCGAACLSMIATYYGLKHPISKYRELTKTDKSGTNVYGLVDGAVQIGLNASALSGSPDDLMEGIIKGEIPFPFIAHTVSEDAMLHYVVVYGIAGDKFQIADPGSSKSRMSPSSFFEMWTGCVITFQKTEQFEAGNYTKGSFTKFFSLLKGQYAKLLAVIIISLLISGIGIAGAFVFKIVIDGFSENTGYYESEETHDHEPTDDSSENTSGLENLNGMEAMLIKIADEISVSAFSMVFITLICLYVLQAIIQFVRGYLIATVSRIIDIRLSLSYYNHIVDLPVSSISVRQTGEYLSRFADTASIRLAISGATLTLLLDSIMVIACGIILAMISKKLFLVGLIIVVLYAVIVLIYRKPVEKSNRQVMEENARLQSYFKESIDGMETVKAACANKQVKNTTTSKFNRFINSVFKNNLISISQDTIADTVELIGTVIILWIGFAMVLENQITIGTLITFYALLVYFTQPIKNLIELQPTIQTALVAADRLNDILDLQSERYIDNDSKLEKVSDWKLKNINFRYGNREMTLQDVNLTVKRGEKIAIVGESGSGKTTLAKLLLGFYEPEQGEIVINEKSLGTLDLSALRKSISYVDQNTFLFSDTIMNNLKLGNSDNSDEEIYEACKKSRTHEFISKLPMGYDTQLDENGMNLSGGQRQRLAIARALLKKPQLLILDEATSNLDTITEASIKNTVFDLDSDLTCIIIAHRLTTIRNCDCIYVMAQGQIVEFGTYEELMQKEGKFSELWKMQ